ncbi:lytic transglycosylase domain-containing protein [Polymorphobacter multimanifer]|uniref:Soluble lytic murein transglycosylase-like protein n=1 Tax=Polymorphobacter multimanifer TaxID=1070431 RepID=A0A841LEA6_9SPHN|nr:lytic transglycosylase domain-containing protein [Polymorphobacter multimanifer]MBB6229373.1 soluble lytic murein transglycosylase-like protein [Polymorphobacter multimanifer]
MLSRIILCVLLSASSPAAAQTAVALDFGQPQINTSGALVTARDGFTLRQLGIWTKTSRARPEDAAAQAPTSLADAVSGDVTASSLPEQSDGNPCNFPGLPKYVPGLQKVVAVRRLSWWRAVAATECRYGIPPGLLDALILQESRYHRGAVSPKGAIGLAQLMPGTAAELGVTDPHDPALNIDAGGRYLRDMLTRFNSVTLGLAAYNAGPGAVRSSRGIPQNSETPDYVRRVLAIWASAQHDPLIAVRHTAQLLGFDPVAK